MDRNHKLILGTLLVLAVVTVVMLSAILSLMTSSKLRMAEAPGTRVPFPTLGGLPKGEPLPNPFSPPENMSFRVDANLWYDVMSADPNPNTLLEVMMLLYSPLQTWQRNTLASEHGVVVVREYNWANAVHCYVRTGEVGRISEYEWILTLRSNVVLHYSEPMSISALFDYVESFQENTDALKAKIGELEDELDDLLAEVKQMNKTIKAQEKTIADQEDLIEDQKATILGRMGEIQKLKAEIEDLEGEIEYWQEVVGNATATIANLEDEIDNLLDQAAGIEEAKKQAEEERDEWRAKYEEEAGKVAELQEDLDQVEARQTELKHSLEKMKLYEALTAVWAIAASIVAVLRGRKSSE